MLTFRFQQEPLNSIHSNLPIILFSYNLCYHTKHFLKCAKRTVDIAIEQDEYTAMDWLESVNMSHSHLH